MVTSWEIGDKKRQKKELYGSSVLVRWLAMRLKRQAVTATLMFESRRMYHISITMNWQILARQTNIKKRV
jgi:hypothetical protein